jgi:hypothetical protein
MEYKTMNRSIAWNAVGALYGFCPRCGAPGEMRESIDGTGKDRCQRKHYYKSTEAVMSANLANPDLAKAKTKDSIEQSKKSTRRRNKR